MASDAQIETNELISATYEHITDVTFVLISHSSAPSSTSCSASPQRIGETLALLPAGMARLPALPLNTTPRELTSLLTPLIHDQFSEGEGIILPTPTKTTMLRGCVSGGDTVPSQSDDVIAGG